MANPVRLAVVGGHRGSSFEAALKAFPEKIQLAALCDLDEALLAKAREKSPSLKTTTSFTKLLEDPNIDAVLIATPMQLHAPQAIQALKAGKHVLSEVIAAVTLDECWELVETVEKTKITYMLSENYCYTRQAMMIKNMCEQNVFGELTTAEGAYLHDCKYLIYNPDNTRTWRGTISCQAQIGRSNAYPTHSMGPIAQWLGITRGDELLRTTTFVTRDAARAEYAAAKFGKDHPEAQRAAWAGSADGASTLIETKNGRNIVLRYDCASPRPHDMARHTLQGTQGAFITGRHWREDPLVWVEGISKGSALSGSTVEPEWQALWELADRFEHPRWKKHREAAEKAGHGGGDFFVLEDFADAIVKKRLPPIDVYDAVTWSAIAPLSAENVRKNGQTLDFPNFLRGKKRGE
jgi:predicted dehydrogenase